MARVAPHFQQTDNVGGLPLPQLGQMVLLDKAHYRLHNLSSSSLKGSLMNLLSLFLRIRPLLNRTYRVG